MDEADYELLVQSVPTIRMYKWGANVTELSGLNLCGEVIKITSGNLSIRLSVHKSQPFWVFLNRLPSENLPNKSTHFSKNDHHQKKKSRRPFLNPIVEHVCLGFPILQCLGFPILHCWGFLIFSVPK